MKMLRAVIGTLAGLAGLTLSYTTTETTLLESKMRNYLAAGSSNDQLEILEAPQNPDE